MSEREPHHPRYVYGTLSQETINGLVPGSVITSFPIRKLTQVLAMESEPKGQAPSASWGELTARMSNNRWLDDQVTNVVVTNVWPPLKQVEVSFRIREMPEFIQRHLFSKKSPESVILEYSELIGNLQDRAQGKIEDVSISLYRRLREIAYRLFLG